MKSNKRRRVVWSSSCSWNAHDKNVLVRHTQWEIKQAALLEEGTSELGGKGAARCPSCSQNAHDKNVLARVTGTSRRAVGR